ncbi:lytic transglycosylase domain-containing protein [Aureimonas mangrovi]|uniref:lytic transglycosylase domain-containing protein n=1 Tax=Aureimonas mangrovi TaxID=2758041 RepID=UPI00163D857F|nr:transglycosylase SLT domain-containing protein [Aureimonas mangrovi]
MLSVAVGSLKALVLSNGRWRPLVAAALVSPLLLTACVSGEGGMVGLAEVGSTPRTEDAAAAETSEDALPGVENASAEASEAAASVTALAPVRENGTISGSAAIDRMITAAADENGVPRELAFAVVHVESRYNPRAKGAGVYGLSQIKPATARSMGFSGSTEALYDPETNLRYGMRYLKGAWERGGGDVCQASMKYKGGHRATTMTRSAQTYCSNVKRHMAAITGRPMPAASEAVQVASAPAEVASTVAAAIAPSARPASPAAQAIEANNTVAAAAPAPVEAKTALAAAVPETPAAETPVAAAAEPEKVTGGRVAHVPVAASAPVATAAFAAPDSARFGD